MTNKLDLKKDEKKESKKIPRSILIIGTFQVATGLMAILLMIATANWNLLLTASAILYIVLGAGLLAIMEWARFSGVIIHAMALVYIILGTVVYGGQSGLTPAAQTAIAGAILYTLTRPHIRAKFRRLPYPPETL